MIIEYHPAVADELKEAQGYYDNRSPGLGKRFVEEFENQVFKIAASPKRWLVVQEDTRRALMTRFPYVIYFRHSVPDTLRITVVKHQRRHPGYGLDRK